MGGGVELSHSHARAVDRDAVAQANVVKKMGWATHRQAFAVRGRLPQTLNVGDTPYALNDSSEHRAIFAGISPCQPIEALKVVSPGHSGNQPEVVTQHLAGFERQLKGIT